MGEIFPVWMDCDTGTDDAVAFLALHALECTDIIGISTVSGNSTLDDSFRNTRGLKRLVGADYPIYRGAAAPLMMREKVHAVDVHGKNGLGNVELAQPESPEASEAPAWDALYEAAVKLEGNLRLITTAPLTNIATAFMKYPKLPSLLHTILIMGGATQEGNCTPCAEFNIYADPEAAQIVFKAGSQSGVPIVMCPLDVTEKVMLTAEDMDELAACGNEAGRVVHDVLQKPLEFHKKLHDPGVQMHDSCPVLYLAYPELFDTEEAGVVVETRGGITLGKTVTDLYSDKQFDFKNALVCLDVDEKEFIKRLKELIKSIK